VSLWRCGDDLWVYSTGFITPEASSETGKRVLQTGEMEVVALNGFSFFATRNDDGALDLSLVGIPEECPRRVGFCQPVVLCGFGDTLDEALRNAVDGDDDGVFGELLHDWNGYAQA